MTISVLMSVYKNEKAERLSRCMRSIWDEQTLKPNQVILVEDGPLPYELHEVIGLWQEKLSDKMTVLKNQENLGLTKSLNKGIAVVNSDLIARMDTDDQSTPIRFSIQEKYMREHPEIDVLGGAYNIMNAAGNIQYAKYFAGVAHYPTPQ
jgi:GT2 family glycosyltransferase